MGKDVEVIWKYISIATSISSQLPYHSKYHRNKRMGKEMQLWENTVAYASGQYKPLTSNCLKTAKPEQI